MIAGSLNFCLFIHFTEKVGLMPLKKLRLLFFNEDFNQDKKTKVKRDAVLQTLSRRSESIGRLLVLDSTFRLNWDKTIIGFQILLLKFLNFESNKKFLVPDFPV
jgi:hypothetical protein